MSGLLLAAAAVQAAARAPVAHLRDLNPYVAAVLGAGARGTAGASMHLPRHAGGARCHACGVLSLVC